ncbi:hypothetical protein, partial [Umezakia ovalisporum]|uniref:hypothetical protein n=1 Tax=Umezakia ovalisporum TaxID=75695 RepID=UPI0039C7334A
MTLGPIPAYLKQEIRKHFLAGLKSHNSLDLYELDLFQWFREETENTWAQMDAEERKYIQEQVDAGAEEINDSGILAADYYRMRMRASHIIFLASLLEGAMKKECDRVSLALGEKVLFKPSELKGDAWSARRVFLERHGSFQIPDEIWKPIQGLLAVRNALAHHSGEVSLLTKEQIAQLSKIPGITVDSSELGIDVSFVDNASKDIRDVIGFLHTQTNELIERAIKP